MKKIAIIGGGIGGFGAALALRQKGFLDITIFEKDPSFSYRRQGYGLTIQQASQALKALNLVSKIKEIDTPSSSHYLFDYKGNVIGFFGRAFYTTEETMNEKLGRYNLHLPRQTLRQILYDEIVKYPSEINISWDMQLDSFVSDNVTSKLVFTNKQEFHFDLVVASDGIFSVVRDLIFNPLEYPEYRLNYLDCVVILGIVELEDDLVYERIWQTLDGCTRLFVMPYSINPHTVMWQLSFPVADLDKAKSICLSKTKIKQVILDDLKVKDWHNPIPQMIVNTKLEMIMCTPVFDRNPLNPMHVDKIPSNVALIGDALHPMSPFKGQGANQALLDAVSLAKHYSKSQFTIKSFTLETLERSYSKVMSSRNRAKVFHTSQVMEEEYHLARGIAKPLLDKVKENREIGAWNAKHLDSLIIQEIRNLENSRTVQNH